MEENKKEEVGKGYKKYFKIIAIILAIILLLVIGFFVFVYIQIQRGEYVKWDGKWYTNEELKEKYPPQYGETPAKNNPEEVYATFRQALLDEDLELALEQITITQRDEYRRIFSIEGKMKEWGGKLSETINKRGINGNFASYSVDVAGPKGDFKSGVSFSKDFTGYWKIDSI